MKQRTLAGRQVSAIGLGAMPMSMNNDNQFPSHEDAVATVGHVGDTRPCAR